MKNEYLIDGDVVRIRLRRFNKEPLWATIDLADFDKVNAWEGTWSAAIQRYKNTVRYYVRQGRFKGFSGTAKALHRYLLDVDDPAILVDHKDGETLNNRRNNLRPATPLLNVINQKRSCRNTSGYRGVFRRERNGIVWWEATAGTGGKFNSLGYFKTPEAASDVVRKCWTERGCGDEYARSA